MSLLDIVKKGSVDRSVKVRIIDSTDGTPETGVVFNTSGIDLWYRREGAAKTSITEATLAALTTAHTDGGFLHIGDGEYRLDLPDAAFATGANHVDIGGTVTGMIVLGCRVRLVDIDLEDTVRAGLTALPNAAAAANGGLPTGDAANSVKVQAKFKKNIAVPVFVFDMTDSTTHNPKPSLGSGVTVTCSKDGGAFAGTATPTVTEIASGAYWVALAAADMNCDVLELRMNAGGADDLKITIYPNP